MIKKVKWISLALLSVCFGVLVGLACVLGSTSKVNAIAEDGIEGIQIKEVYELNEQISFPQQPNVVVGGTSHATKSGVLLTPSGEALALNGSIVFSEHGQYILRYYYGTETTYYYDTNLIVAQKNMDVSSTSSSAEYGKISMDRNADEVFGVAVQLNDTDTFKFNRKFDINQTQGLVDFITLRPQNYQESLQYTVKVRFTDCYDPSIFIDFILSGAGNLYMRAGFENNVNWGWNTNCTKTNPHIPVLENDVNYTAQGGNYGTSTGCSYVTGQSGGHYEQHGTDNGGITFKYDCTTQRVYASVNKQADVLVNDFSCTQVYSTSSFAGFTTGEVYVSMTANRFTDTTMNIYIAEILGVGGEELADTHYIDSEAPDVQVTYTPTVGEQVYSVVGASFPIFDYTVYDVSLRDSNVEVYYCYGTEKQVKVFIDENNRFLTAKAGPYSIVYTAQDVFGNFTKCVIPVICQTSENGQDEIISIVIPQSETESIVASAGNEVQLPSVEKAVVDTCNLDTMTYAVKAIYEQEGVVIDVDIDDMTFTPNYVGMWKIVYEAWDNIDRAEFVFDLNVQTSDVVIADGIPCFTRKFIKGYKYSLDAYYGYAFEQAGRTQVALTPWVSFDDGVFTKIEDVNEFEIIGNASMKIQYRYRDAIVCETDDIPIVDIGFGVSKNLDLTKYFYGDFDVTAEVDNMAFKATSRNASRLSFIKEISASNFDIKLRAASGSTEVAFNTLSIILTDYYNLNNCLTLKLQWNEGLGITTFYAGNASGNMNANFADGSNYTITYNTDNNKFIFTLGSNKVELFSKFNFKTDKVFMDIVLDDVNIDNATLKLLKLNGQTLSASGKDNSLPMITTDLPSGNVDIDTVIDVETPVVLDALSPVLSKDITFSVSYMSLTSSAKSTVYSTNGAALDNVSVLGGYSFKVDKYGKYTVKFSVKDQNNKSTNMSYLITCYDFERPTVTLKNEVREGATEELALGATHTVLPVQASHSNPEAGVETFYYVMDEHMYLTPIVDGAFTPDVAGKYTVYVYAKDTSGNVAYTYYYVTVK